MNDSFRPAVWWLLVLILLIPAQPLAAERLTPEYLRCEYRVDPLGIETPAPRLSWQVKSARRNEWQGAYEIRVARSEAALGHRREEIWHSGKVESDETTRVIYRGPSLLSGQYYWWQVRVWDKDGYVSSWSPAAKWSMGLLNPAEWQAQWIGWDNNRKPSAIAAPFDGAQWIRFAADPFPKVPKGNRQFLSELVIPASAKINRAHLLVAAQSRVFFNINGQAVSLSHSSVSNQARMVDVASLIKPGTNTLRVQVENAQEGPSGLIAKLAVTADDGQSWKLVTDGSWHSTDNGGANWHSRPIALNEWPPCQVIGPAGCAPWGQLKYTPLLVPAPAYLRKEFQVGKKVRRATLYSTALGLIDCQLNGRLVGGDRFTPGWTDYKKRVYYRAYDVTSRLRPGRNALDAILGDGWYSGYIGWQLIREQYGRHPRARVQLQIDYADGSREIVGTGPDWKAAGGAITAADFLMGETYDARLETKWSEPGFNDQAWAPADAGADFQTLVQADPGPPIRVFAEIKPQAIRQIRPGVYIADMGQNFAGVVRLKVQGKAGQKITLRFAERLSPDGNIYTVNLRGAAATDNYICRGKGTETWEPRFTYHGFQYVEVTGLTSAMTPETITGLALSSATADAGNLACSDPMLNRLVKNTYWTQRANFMDIPTDCPQRDERLGWMGDAQVYIRAATLHEDVEAFFTKWMVDVADGQRADGEYPMVAPVKVAGDDGGPAWADAGVICPWTIYEVYGDRRLLEQQYDSMARFIAFTKKRSTSDMLPPKNYQCFGDWLNIQDETPKAVIYTAYFAQSVQLMAQIAQVLGKTEDAANYRDLFDKIKASFRRAYVKEDGLIEGDTQTDYVLALSFGLLDADQEKQAADHLVRNIEKRHWHLSTGFIGTKSLMLALARIGRDDVAYRLIYNDTFPSWGFSIKQGATSIWERWDGWTPDKGFQDPGMNSFAHYSFGAVYQWMVENMGGIRSDGPAYKHILIAPHPDDKLTFADTIYDSIHGPIETHWKKTGRHFSMQVVIPANTTATVEIPLPAGSVLSENAGAARRREGIISMHHEGDKAVVEIGSGVYEFSTN